MELILFIVMVFLVFKGIPWTIREYNQFMVLKNACLSTWSIIDIYLKKRSDLIPNLVAVVKGYASHEKTTLEDVIHARNTYSQTGDIKEEIHDSIALDIKLKKMMVLVENYPDLKANTQFLELQKQLTDIEDELVICRIAYNKAVESYKNKKEMFPSNLIYSIFEFTDFEYYTTEYQEIQL